MWSVVVSLFHSFRFLVQSRASLHLEIIALRHQLAVVHRSRRPRQNSSPLIFRIDASHDRCMLELLLVVARALALALRGHRELVLENLALRQQLTAMKRSANRPRLERGDRLFWIALTRVWQNWRTALVVVQPDTVVRWHRDWLRCRWTRRLKGRP